MDSDRKTPDPRATPTLEPSLTRVRRPACSGRLFTAVSIHASRRRGRGRPGGREAPRPVRNEVRAAVAARDELRFRASARSVASRERRRGRLRVVDRADALGRARRRRPQAPAGGARAPDDSATPLHCAALCGTLDVPLLSALLRAAAGVPDAPSSPRARARARALVDARDALGATPLHYAARRADARAVRARCCSAARMPARRTARARAPRCTTCAAATRARARRAARPSTRPRPRARARSSRPAGRRGGGGGGGGGGDGGGRRRARARARARRARARRARARSRSSVMRLGSRRSISRWRAACGASPSCCSNTAPTRRSRPAPRLRARPAPPPRRRRRRTRARGAAARAARARRRRARARSARR